MKIYDPDCLLWVIARKTSWFLNTNNTEKEKTRYQLLNYLKCINWNEGTIERGSKGRRHHKMRTERFLRDVKKGNLQNFPINNQNE